jgi:hypothetical protein
LKEKLGIKCFEDFRDKKIQSNEINVKITEDVLKYPFYETVSNGFFIFYQF